MLLSSIPEGTRPKMSRFSGVLYASSRRAGGWTSFGASALGAFVPQQQQVVAPSSSTSSVSSGKMDHWPTPDEFNALPLSVRSKLYCDFGDAGKMTWVPHDEPVKVG